MFENIVDGKKKLLLHTFMFAEIFLFSSGRTQMFWFIVIELYLSLCSDIAA